MILGIDEVGRGPWAGPLVVGAVVLGGVEIEGLTDSKKLTKKRRELLYDEIYERVSGIGLGWVTSEEIDTIGLSASLKLATKRAVQQVTEPYHEIIIDGTINFLSDTPLEQYVTTLKKADLLIPSVSAASIVAKVARDRYMATQDEVYEGYNFASHVGYGTDAHREAITRLGVTPLHRLSFAPLARYRPREVATVKTQLVSTKRVGDRAEELAAMYLIGNGHTILDRNWKTKYCEIDIVSIKHQTMYFTEVKYRKRGEQGGGLAAITPKKLKQMRYAAEFYVHAQKITDAPLQVSALSISGDPMLVDSYIEHV